MLEHFVETIPPQGSMGAHGYRNLLGRPPGLSPIDVLVRETVQNIWDARLPGAVPRAVFAVRTLDVGGLREMLGDSASRPELFDLGQDVKAIEISDYNTVGLGGPVRADVPLREGENKNYVDFVLNFGVPPQTPGGAGTYGYGRSILYRASRNNLIAIYSRTEFEGQYESRLTLAALWNAKGFETGRHWFGRVEPDPRRPAPVRGDEADALAERLGFTVRTGDATGTSILVVNPLVRSDDETDEVDLDAGQMEDLITISVLEHCWPKLVTIPSLSRSQMTIDVGGSAVCSPGTIPSLRPFEEAFLAVLGEKVVYPVTSIRQPYGAGDAGRVSVCPIFEGATPPAELPHALREHFENWRMLNTVALMRAPNLIVKYYGDRSAMEGVRWGGVFKVAEEDTLDSAFAVSEPPTHDDWEPRNVIESREKRRIVKTTLRNLDGYLRERCDRRQDLPRLGDAVAPSVSIALTKLLPFSFEMREMTGTRRPGGGGGGGKGRNSAPTVEVVGHDLAEDGARVVAIVDVRVKADDGRDWTLSPHLRVLLEDGAVEKEVPVGSSSPEVLDWSIEGVSSKGPVVSSGSKTVRIRIKIVDDARVALDPTVEYL